MGTYLKSITTLVVITTFLIATALAARLHGDYGQKDDTEGITGRFKPGELNGVYYGPPAPIGTGPVRPPKICRGRRPYVFYCDPYYRAVGVSPQQIQRAIDRAASGQSAPYQWIGYLSPDQCEEFRNKGIKCLPESEEAMQDEVVPAHLDNVTPEPKIPAPPPPPPCTTLLCPTGRDRPYSGK